MHNRIVGIDISPEVLRKAQRRVAKLSLNNVERLETMDAEHPSFPDGSFNVVVASHVISTGPHPLAALDECARMLRPDGELILINRVGADAGARRTFERLLQPIGASARLAHGISMETLRWMARLSRRCDTFGVVHSRRWRQMFRSQRIRCRDPRTLSAVILLVLSTRISIPPASKL